MYSAMTGALESHSVDSRSSSHLTVRTGNFLLGLLLVRSLSSAFFFEQEVETSECFRTCRCMLPRRCRFEFMFKKMFSSAIPAVELPASPTCQGVPDFLLIATSLTSRRTF